MRDFLRGPFRWLLLGLVLGGFAADQIDHRSFAQLYAQIHPVRASDPAYPLINRLLTYDFPSSEQFHLDQKLQRDLESFGAQKTKSGDVTSISIYYRRLLQGQWMGIDENKTYNPASLMKVAIMIAYFQDARTNPGILQHKIVYTSVLDNALRVVPFQTPSTLKVGTAYTVDQLIEALMIHSDNGAKNALLSGIDERLLAEVYTDLGIENPDNASGAYVISAKAYSLFFRILYNATYLNRALSQRALDLLVQAQYKDGIVAGVPAGVTVAQKYGEYVATDGSGEPVSYELHDCGIVYKKDDPYFLCVMTKGKDFGALTKTIQQISRLVYDQTP